MDSDEEDVYYTSSDDDDAEYPPECGGDDEIVTDKSYTVLREETMKQLQQADISEVSNVLAVTRAVACTLLLRHNWSVAAVFDEWFADEDRVRSSVGISTNPKRPRLEDALYCKICMETVDLRRTPTLSAAACGHSFCSRCWAQYVAVSINDGPGCLRLRCPEPKCAAAAGLDTVEAVAAADDLQKFHHYLYRSYVESNRSRKWCPGPGCELAVEFDGAAETYDVTCDCGYKFCWRCTEEQHRPVGCETVAKWAEKNRSESDNTTWILAYTKPCPSCGKKIEKNQGCNHMTCTCRHDFCWFCRQQWKNAGHLCNEYLREAEAAVDVSLIETREELKKYAHYFERWASNHKSREMAAADAARARDERVPALAAAQEVKDTEARFVAEAWEQVVDCRRVLKWSYAYGYYVKGAKKKEMFEFLQGRAEEALEKLHHCAEKEAAQFAEGPSEKFPEFRWKLTNLTGVTKQYFENLVRALENHLSEVES